jgi:DNA gyrase/topoisomerase IV subunit A
MDLYAKPIITTQDDGTISIKVLPITPEYIDTRLAELAVFGQTNYNIEEVVAAVQNTPSLKQAAKRLKTTLGIGSAEADFLLDLTIEEMAYYFDRDNCEKEIAKWNKLKVLLV